MNILLTGVSSLVDVEGKQKWKRSEASKASLPLPLPLKKSTSHSFRFHITAVNKPSNKKLYNVLWDYCHVDCDTETLALDAHTQGGGFCDKIHCNIA